MGQHQAQKGGSLYGAPFGPGDLDLSRLLAVLLRLGQSRSVKGSRGETTRGLLYLDCTRCPSRLQRARGCHRFGHSYPGPEWRIDFTGTPEHDVVRWCPASVLDHAPSSLRDALSFALRVEARGGTVATIGRPLYLMPAYWVSFFELSLASRDRFLKELDDAYKEVT